MAVKRNGKEWTGVRNYQVNTCFQALVNLLSSSRVVGGHKGYKM